jgi:BlaI family transcriptional regulator, penicillinase repressor
LTRPGLANAELAVMELLWDRERLTARQIQEALYPDATRAQHGTVQKLLQRLEEKGFVERDRSLPVHFFTVTIGRDAYACDQLESLADRLTGGSLVPLITQLVEEHKLTRAEIRRLKRILEDL